MSKYLTLLAAVIFSSLVSLDAAADPVTISIGEVAEAIENSSASNNALAQLAASKVNEALEAEGFAFDMDQLIVAGDIEGEERPCTGFWSPGGSYDLTLDADTALSVLVETLAEPIVFSVTLIGDLEADVDFQLRVGVKIFGKCIRLARDTITVSADADFNVTVTVVVDLNPVLDESGPEAEIYLSPDVEVMGDINTLNADIDVSGVGGQYFNFWSLIPVVGPFINDPVLNFAANLLDLEHLAQEAIDDAAEQLQTGLQNDLSLWAIETPLILPPISMDTLADLAPLSLEPGLMALPVTADYYNENRNRLLYAFLIGDRAEVNDILTGAAVCAAAAALATPGMDRVPVYSSETGGCAAIDVTDTSLSGPFYMDSGCSTQIDFAPLSFAGYCAETVAASPNYKLGNATGLSPDQQKWRAAPATAIDVTVDSIGENFQPYFKRESYRTITGIIDGYRRDYALIDYQCSDPAILESVCGCYDPNNYECTSCTDVYQRVCYRLYNSPPLGQGPADVTVPRGSGTCDLEMRVYKKDPAATNLRPLIALHGGSWRYRGFGFFGLESIISHFTDEDYAVFVPFYRLTGEADGNVECNGSYWEDITGDVEAALTWVQNNGIDYGALPVPVRVVGQSAGGHLAIWLAVNRPSDVYAGWTAYPPTDAANYITEYLSGDDVDPFIVSGPAARALRDFLDADLDNIDLTSDAVVRNSFPTLVESSPVSYPDLFIAHGVADALVPASQSVRLCNGYSGNSDIGPATEFGGDPDSGTYQAAYACEPDRTQLRLYAEADHALEFCIPGLACPAGSEGSQAAVRSGIRDAIEFLGGQLLDTDGDLISDDQDNCITYANPDQFDADADGFGNACDPDYNNDCQVNIYDMSVLRAAFWSSDPFLNLVGDDVLNFEDLFRLKAMIYGPPGPSGVTDTCQ